MIYQRFSKCLPVPLVELGACRTQVSDSPFGPRNPRHLLSRPKTFLRILKNGEISSLLLIRTFFRHCCLMIILFMETLGANRFVPISRYLNQRGEHNRHELPEKKKRENNLTVYIDFRQF